jgi:sec-independent protein translocase protein TatC
MARKEQPTNMPLGDHLDELRRRLMVAMFGLIPLIVISLVVGRRVLGFIMQPAMDALVASGYPRTMISGGPLDGFGTYIKLSMILTVLVGSPWLLYQLWKFVAPGLYSHERRFVYFLLPLSAVLTVIGVSFLYIFIMPLLLRFFLDFGSDLGAAPIPTAPLPEGVALSHIPVLTADPVAPQVGDEWINTAEMLRRTCVAVHDGKPVIYSTQMLGKLGLVPMYRVTDYVKLLLSLSLAFAAAFQTPVVVLLLGWARILDRKFLKKYRKHALLACAIAAALLTPGDPASMLLMMVPLYLLYELGGILLKYFPASRVAGDKPEKPQPEEQPDDAVGSGVGRED